VSACTTTVHSATSDLPAGRSEVALCTVVVQADTVRHCGDRVARRQSI
jgi:hypothetical protein